MKKVKLKRKQKNDDNPTKNLISVTKVRIFLCLSIFLFIVLSGRLFFLQLVNGEYLTTLAVNQQTSREVISGKRGNIYDATGSSLAISETVDTISINPSKVKAKTDKDTPAYKELVAKGLSEIFNLNYDEMLKKVNDTASVITIARKVEQDKVDKLKAWMKENKAYAGINIDEDTKRYYPNGTLASQVIGICGTDNQGLSGIEYSYDSILKGTSGQIITSKDASQTEIPNSVKSFVQAEDGYNINLTIDVNVQRIAEKYMKEAIDEYKCERGGNVIIMEPSTGNIIAMASYPNYDLNDPYTPTSYYATDWDKISKEERLNRIYEMWTVRSVSEMYEPGSVFKLVTASAALEENITTTDKKEDFFCAGYEKVANKSIHCWADIPHGKETLRDALVNSCNPAFIQLGQRLGKDTLYKYYESFGLFAKTNIGLSGEASGMFFDIDKVGPVELATMSFGQRFTITPLQMCTVVSAIANGGYLVKPNLVKSMTNTDTGEVIETETQTIRQVISSQTAEKMRDMMKSYTDYNRKTQIQGYSIGGKTGTSEPNPSSPEKGYVASFAAITPLEDSKVVCLLTLYDPQGSSHQGSQTAAPTVSKILTEVMPYLGIEPDLASDSNNSTKTVQNN